MTPRDLRNIHTTRNSCRDTFPCATWHWSIPVFLPADGEAFWSLLPSSVSLLSGGTVQPENTYSCILKVTGQVWESQKRISINTNHRYHKHSFPEVSLSWPNDKNKFSFNQPDRKRWAGRCNKTSTPSLEGWSTKTKKAPSTQVAFLIFAKDTLVSFSWLKLVQID